MYSLIQAQYDAARRNPPWETKDEFDIDDRPRKKRRRWFYEIVQPDGTVVDVVDPDVGTTEESAPTQPRSPSPSSVQQVSGTHTPLFVQLSPTREELPENKPYSSPLSSLRSTPRISEDSITVSILPSCAPPPVHL